MSKIGNHRVGMQENPLYEEGWKAFCKGVERDYVEDGQPFYAEDNAAWQLGWDDAKAAGLIDGAKGGAATSIDVHQRRGIMATCITLALRDYDEWQKDDDYNFIAALERVINHLEPAREVALQEFSQ